MKILALGGCGEMGRHAVRLLIASRLFKETVIADIHEQRAKEFASQFDQTMSWKKLDIDNEE